MSEEVDLAIVGAGAAGLMAAIQAARRAPGARILALDGARSLGAKILVAGGGRCNVTHFEVEASDFAGSSRNSIAKVLRELPVPATIDFFRGIGVELKREPTGKLFPVTDKARTVLEALLRAAREAGVTLLYPRRVTAIARTPGGFVLSGDWGEVAARRVILAAGGQALPKSGSDGGGYALARALGHTTTATIFPSLVPLLVPEDHWLRTVQGIAVPARIEVRAGSGKRLSTFRGDLLCTHFGLSGPVVLDASRHFLAARQTDPQARFVVAFLPDATAEKLSSGARQPRPPQPRTLAGGEAPRPARRRPACAAPGSTRPRTPCGSRKRSARRSSGRFSSTRFRSPATAASSMPRRPPAAFRSIRCASKRWSRGSAPAFTSAARSSTSTVVSAASTSSGPGRAARSPEDRRRPDCRTGPPASASEAPR